MGVPTSGGRVALTRAEQIDKLNALVKLKTAAAVEAAQEAKKPLAPEFAATAKGAPKSLFVTGLPVYELRSEFMVWFSLTAALAMVATGTAQVGLPTLMVCIVMSYFAYDLYSGILHVCLDEPTNIPLPLVGQSCLEFQWHHHIPHDIVSKSFLDVCGDLVVPTVILGILHYTWSARGGTDPIALILSGMKLVMAYFGQFSHASAHRPATKKRHPIVKLLQDSGIMISFKLHRAHHKPPHEEDFCLMGVCEPIIVGMRMITRSPMAWLATFLLWSIFEIRAMTIIARYSGLYAMCGLEPSAAMDAANSSILF